MFVSAYRAKVGGALLGLGLCSSLGGIATAEPVATAEEPPRGVMTKAPQLVKFVEAELGPGAPLLEDTTVVRLEFTIEVDGSVQHVVVVTPRHPVLDGAAVAAAESFEFEPARVDEQVAAVRIQYEYVFYPDLDPSEPVEHATDSPPERSAPTERTVIVPTGVLQGRLLQAGTRKPLIGASVALPQLGLQVLTDANGAFAFPSVPVGKIEIRLSDVEHVAVSDTEQVQKSRVTEVTYYAERVGFEQDDLVAVGRRAKKEVVRREITRRELSTVPGSNGDAVKAVQNLPGVARSAGDEVVLRGVGSNQIYVNGHPIMTAFHFGGLRSTVANGLIDSLEVTPGNYDIRYGGTNGGIVNVQTRRPSVDALHGTAQLDLYDASAFVQGPVGDHGAFAVGGRRSYIDGVLQLALNEEDLSTFKVAPRYYDFQAAYDWQKDGQRVRVNALGANDVMVLLIEEPDPNDPAARGEIKASTYWTTAQALWDYRISSATQVSASLSYLRAEFNQSLQEVRINLANDTFSLRGELTHQFAPWFTIRTGVDARMSAEQIDVVVPPPPSEGDPQEFRFSTADNLATRETVRRYNPAIYWGLEFDWGPLQIHPGLRMESFNRPGQTTGAMLLQPRVNLRLALSEFTSLKAGVGWYSEAAQLVEANRVYGNPRIEPPLSRHFSAGVEQQLSEEVSLDATGFYQDLIHQVSPQSDPSLRYDNSGAGRVLGGELLVKYSATSRFYGWLAYTLMRSERRDRGATNYRLFDGDQTHNLNLVAQVRLTPKWEVGARFRLVSGNPTTPVKGAIYDSDADIYTPLYGDTNSARLASFHQLDLRVDRHWTFDTWKLTTYLDLQNSYNRKNSEDVEFNYNYTRSRPVAGLPLIPSFGIKGEF